MSLLNLVKYLQMALGGTSGTATSKAHTHATPAALSSPHTSTHSPHSPHSPHSHHKTADCSDYQTDNCTPGRRTHSDFDVDCPDYRVDAGLAASVGNVRRLAACLRTAAPLHRPNARRGRPTASARLLRRGRPAPAAHLHSPLRARARRRHGS